MSFCTYIVLDKKAIFWIQLYRNYLQIYIYIGGGGERLPVNLKYVISIANLIGDLIYTTVTPMLPLTKEEINDLNEQRIAICVM